ncbi:MAG: sulfotransferase [Candidatus Neomarinimicrobiota bacterium]|nr:MAG: sulfotransferase [Candidatus Neomarinimicrobiota bacterium]
MGRNSVIGHSNPAESQRESLMDAPLLVTGCPRSGTTWVGKTLALHPDMGYLQEPFNNDHNQGRVPGKWPHRFFYIHSGNAGTFRPLVEQLFHFTYYPVPGLFARQSWRDRAMHLKEFCLWTRARWMAKRPLIKDPFAFFSTPWLVREMGVKPIILIRHPAAVISSIKRLNWNLRFDHFLEQPELMQDWLWDLAEEIQSVSTSQAGFLAKGIVFWKLFYQTVIKWETRYPDWIFLKHEDLSRHPVAEFAQLYQKLGLKFDPSIRRKIIQMTESTSHTEIPSTAPAAYVTVNSRANLTNWKKRLHPEEIQTIYVALQPLWSRFYSENDW